MSAANTTTGCDLAKAKLNLETSRIPWKDLQRFFASGLAIQVSNELDLIEVAYQVAQDNREHVEHWLHARKIGHVSDQQALKWYEEETEVWALVVKPWVLVQQ